MSKRQHIIPTTQFLFFVIIFGMSAFGNIMAILVWSELEDFSTKLMEDEDFNKNLSPTCVENVAGLGWKSANSTVINADGNMFYSLFGDASIEESGCNIVDLAENEPLKALYRHVPQWYVNSDTIWLLIGVIGPTLLTVYVITLLHWPRTKSRNKFYKFESSFRNKIETDFIKNTIPNIIIWVWVIIVWMFTLYVMVRY